MTSPEAIAKIYGQEQSETSYRIIIKGVVQGVGFRPFVYRTALEHGIAGEVKNTPEGVLIDACGDPSRLKKFLTQLESQTPPLAVIHHIEYQEISPLTLKGFSIVESQQAGNNQVILPPDVTICPACEQELLDPTNRRYLYPFNNCTNCGPRYTIIEALPYDRSTTAMKPFPLCADCLQEYRNPADRRYHAEATSCPQCGPQLQLTTSHGEVIECDNPILWIAEKISAGAIVAVQGVGGFHLICDALNDQAVQLLRRRKRRPTKPFAVMVKDMPMARQYGMFNDHSSTLIQSYQRPIVIVPATEKCSPQLNGGLDKVGLFLPYTPLHQIIFHYLERPVVATSANVSEEPIITNAETLVSQLGAVVDFVLAFNRRIVNGCDDSVVTTVGEHQLTLRRARGYTPTTMKLPAPLNCKVLAVGAGQKNTIAIGWGKQAIVSAHVGDLHSPGAEEYFVKTIDTFKRLYNFEPELIVHDLHPNYVPTRWAKQQNIPCKGVQHHYAHALSAMIDCGIGLDHEIAAVCWDGSGYGDDGTVWGGEFLNCSYHGYRRFAHFKPFRLLGAEQAVKEPRRVALSLLFDLYGEQAMTLNNPTINSFSQDEIHILYQMHSKGLNSPLTSSAGRMFDAVASLLGIKQVLSYEGESGMLMDQYYDETLCFSYPFTYKNNQIECSSAIMQLAAERDLIKGVTGYINMLVNIIIAVLHSAGRREALLCGGVFQNTSLVYRLLAAAHKTQIKLHLPKNIPVNDGGIALGQIAATLAHNGSIKQPSKTGTTNRNDMAGGEFYAPPSGS
ncbi:MAG: carbamoyltransferase HypF [Desulfuromonas sp.]|nr:carbamoyltransferase HypF [Desulfuromonas sp.]